MAQILSWASVQMLLSGWDCGLSSFAGGEVLMCVTKNTHKYLGGQGHTKAKIVGFPPLRALPILYCNKDINV